LKRLSSVDGMMRSAAAGFILTTTSPGTKFGVRRFSSSFSTACGSMTTVLSGVVFGEDCCAHAGSASETNRKTKRILRMRCLHSS
jgi:hypothetical protein